MIVTKYERKFRELLEFASHMISDETIKTLRFVDGLNKDIALCTSRADHPTYQSASDVALEVKRQRALCGSRR